MAMAKHDDAIAHLDRLQTLYTRVEGKASFLFAANIAMLGIVAFNYNLSEIASITGVSGAISEALLITSLVQIYRSYFPHLKGSSYPSLIYFEEIAKLSESEFVRTASLQSDAQRLDDALHQVWRNAQILSLKFNRITQAFVWTAIAIPIWLVFLASLTFSGKVPIWTPAG